MGAVVGLLLAGCVSYSYTEPELGPKDDTGDVEYSNYRISCTCDCESVAAEVSYPSLDINHLCLPAGTAAAEYCAGVMCPALALYHRNRVAESEKYECEDIDVTCEPGAKNSDGETTNGGASRVKETKGCEGDCAEILCVDETAEYCTYASTDCPESESSPTFCRATDEASQSQSVERVASSRRNDRDDPGALPRSGADEAAWPVALAAPWPGASGQLTAAACSPGHGEFVLVPIREYDRNGDGERLSLSRPLQVEGTGRLTPDAWITHARVTWPRFEGGSSVYALRPGHQPQVLPSDRLDDLASATVAIGNAVVEPQPGVLGGGSDFAQLAAQSELVPTIIDLGWECSRAGALPGGPTYHDGGAIRRDAPKPHAGARKAVTLPTAEYSFTLGEVGCDVEWPQRFSLRARVESTVATFSVGLLGDSRDVRRGRSFPGEGGDALEVSFKARGLRVVARVLGLDDDMAVFRVKRTTFRGREVCRPGVYYLRGER